MRSSVLFYQYNCFLRCSHSVHKATTHSLWYTTFLLGILKIHYLPVSLSIDIIAFSSSISQSDNLQTRANSRSMFLPLHQKYIPIPRRSQYSLQTIMPMSAFMPFLVTTLTIQFPFSTAHTAEQWGQPRHSSFFWWALSFISQFCAQWESGRILNSEFITLFQLDISSHRK